MLISCVASGILIALSLFVVSSNWCIVFSNTRHRNAIKQPQHCSMVPLLGGILGAIGCWLTPAFNVTSLWWVPLSVDPGCAMMLVGILISGARNVVHSGS